MKYSLKPGGAVFGPLLIVIGIAVVMFMISHGCKLKESSNSSDRFTSNHSEFVADESFQPIVDEELFVFKALNQNAHPKVVYAPESNAVNLLLNDSVRVAILARNLTPQENNILKTRNLRPVVTRFAIGAVALIVNGASNDTTISVSEIKKILTGDTKADKNIVFDNPNSSLVRYLKDLAGSKGLKQRNIYSLKSNKEVIKYVSLHPDAMGIVGFSWLNDPDKDYADAVQKVKIVGVRDDTGKKPSKQYFTPSQATLALNEYPLTRNLYILNCTGNYSLGKEFADFIEGDRGQRIVLKSGLLPDNIPGRAIEIEQRTKL